MDTRMFGAVVLLVGTSVGGGMLALPVAVTYSGYFPGLLLLLISWAVMTLGAFLILEVNLWYPEGNNLISMCHQTLGRIGQSVVWVCYFVLFYSLIAVYISGGRDIVNTLTSVYISIDFPLWLDAVIFTLLFGTIVYLGMQTVDYCNRILMLLKALTFFFLFVVIIPHVDVQYLKYHDFTQMACGVTVMFTAFGFANIVPSLRTFLHGDIDKMRKILLIGSLITLSIYLLWMTLVLGSIPKEGEHSLSEILKSGKEVTGIAAALEYHLQNSWLYELGRVFASVSVSTSFLGVSIGLSDFLADGLNLAKEGSKKLLVIILTLLPSLLVLLYYPKLFLTGLRYAGICCAIILVLIPILIAWRGRYHFGIASDYTVWGGRITLLLGLMGALFFLAIGIIYDLHLMR